MISTTPSDHFIRSDRIVSITRPQALTFLLSSFCGPLSQLLPILYYLSVIRPMELRGGRLQRFFRLPSGCGWWKPPGSPGTFVLEYPGIIRTGTRINGSLLLHCMFLGCECCCDRLLVFQGLTVQVFRFLQKDDPSRVRTYDLRLSRMETMRSDCNTIRWCSGYHTVLDRRRS